MRSNRVLKLGVSMRLLCLLGLTIVCLLLAKMVPMVTVDSNLEDDEVVAFFPTFAQLNQDETTWNINLHGWIFEPEEDSKKRAVLLGLLRRGLGLEKHQAETALFRERARLFLVDNERGKRIAIRLREKEYLLDASEPNGHFEMTVLIPAAAIQDRVASEAENQNPWLTFKVVAREKERQFGGQVQLVGPDGLSVISDIDDTIKISNVADKKELLANTFLRAFEAVPGMAAAYRRWAEKGVVFHYVSASPWQLYGPLADFLKAAGFPKGSLHLKAFRWKDSSFFDLFTSPKGVKFAAIESILAKFPRRRFVLIGDSSEQDPEIYGEVARKYPGQAVHIYIRKVPGQGENVARFQLALKSIPKERWTVFTDPAEIEP